MTDQTCIWCGRIAPDVGPEAPGGDPLCAAVSPCEERARQRAYIGQVGPFRAKDQPGGGAS